ncbi:MAG: AAA family ATPase, partial [Deltaproteobacteria bacterium]|nr:AAA family ATPase [Deltaproteobacteria bacterium]
MNASFKKISTDFTSFRKLINEDYIYVDKTGLLRELIEGSSKNIFLSRPRRFGKSLVLNTILEIFSGDQDLFKGLQIEQSGYDFPKYPVLKLDMSIPCSSPEELRLEIFNALTNLATKNGLTLKSTSYGAALKELIEKTRDVHNKDVVVLIDEYDYPVSSKINNKTKANNNSEVLADFYASFKSVNDLLRFALVTGVTRNSMMGISAGLNNLDDISLDKKYAAICGFTPEEIDRYFADRYPAILQTLRKNNYSSKIEGRGVLSSLSDLKEETLHWYDGYSWDGRTKVLNPISVLKFIDTHTFKSYWALTSTSS